MGCWQYWLSNWARRCNISHLSQTNPGPQADGIPCRIIGAILLKILTSSPKAKREVMERHEAECGYRDVPCIVATCPKYVKFKDYSEHIFEHHSITKRPVWVFNRKQRRNTLEDLFNLAIFSEI